MEPSRNVTAKVTQLGKAKAENSTAISDRILGTVPLTTVSLELL